MYQVELDIFSGRPNPIWTLSPKEEQELVDRLEADPAQMLPVTAATEGLGYRGYVVTRVKEGSIDRPGKAGRVELPSRFRLGGATRLEKDQATALWLLDTSERADTEVDDYIREVAAQSIQRPIGGIESQPGGLQSAPEKGSLATCASNYFTSSSNFTFWNGAAYITKNNCYNYASNHRTNTFAQPGRISGHPITALSCSNVSSSVQWDGWANSCVASNNLTIALVIWPGVDFHFYRKASGGIWCHKPGQTAARNYDNSGVTITNPETCNRGGYTSFCGYWYADNNTIAVS